ncbi:MAG: F0F1 ATP synthase subunit A, partial [Chloroflexota bacterium]|nr:F0F1 ATP synthase subunit A [Chloroflexota bacterium]
MEIHVELAAETLFHLGPIPITNAMLTTFIVMALIFIAFTLIARRAQLIPGRTQGAAETIVEFILSLVENTAGRHNGRRIFPLIGGLFIFILFSNFSGLLPGVGSVGVWHEEETAAESEAAVLETAGEQHVAEPAAEGVAEEPAEAQQGAPVTGEEHAAEDEAAATGEEHAATEEHHEVLVPLLRPPTADLNMTLAMALVTFTTVQIYGIRSHGFLGRIKHMADPPFLFPIELISELSRIISLSARLFGNVFAGEVLLGVMYAMAASIRIAVVPVLFPVVFLFLELLFGTIQALVFALLTLIYITLATAGGHGEEAHEAHVEGAHG